MEHNLSGRVLRPTDAEWGSFVSSLSSPPEGGYPPERTQTLTNESQHSFIDIGLWDLSTQFYLGVVKRAWTAPISQHHKPLKL
jgi:hypothetical protein